MRKLYYTLFVNTLLLTLCTTAIATATGTGNTLLLSYSNAKKILHSNVYITPQERVTLYCVATFQKKNSINLPHGFSAQKHKKRMQRMEWEHVVPAENFGRTFSAWRNGDALCVNAQGRAYKGRKCAEKVSQEFRHMYADMYNIYPSIGAVNALRSNYNFAMLPHEQSKFGACSMKIDKNRKVEPPENSRGKISRAYLYMETTYPRYKMSKSQRKLMLAWHKNHPVTKDECTRTRRIEEIQGNENTVVKNSCIASGLW